MWWNIWLGVGFFDGSVLMSTFSASAFTRPSSAIHHEKPYTPAKKSGATKSPRGSASVKPSVRAGAPALRGRRWKKAGRAGLGARANRVASRIRDESDASRRPAPTYFLQYFRR